MSCPPISVSLSFATILRVLSMEISGYPFSRLKAISPETEGLREIMYERGPRRRDQGTR
jgi:hypothetical protein